MMIGSSLSPRSLAYLLATSACALTLAGCATPSDTVEPSEAVVQSANAASQHSAEFEAQLHDASKGIENAKLQSLFQKHWAWKMEQNPLFATELGVRDFDDKLFPNTREAHVQNVATMKSLLAEAAKLQEEQLSASDRLNLDLVSDSLKGRIAASTCERWSWNISTGNNPLDDTSGFYDRSRVETAEDGQALLSRYKQATALVRTEVDNMKYGLSKGRVGNAESIKRTITMLRRHLTKPVDEWELMGPAKATHAGWTAQQLTAHQSAIRAEVETGFAPALKDYVDFIETTLLPSAHPDSEVGVSFLPGGDECYQGRIVHFTGLEELNAKKLHELGNEQIAVVNKDMQDIGERLFKTRDLKKILHHLRTDKSMFFTTEEEVESFARNAVAEAKSKMGDFFGIVPKAECQVLPTPAFEAPFSDLGYYRDPAPDGSRPGQYFINTYKPETRPRYEAMVLAIHEAIPGHHLQVAIAQELESVPAFRRHGSPEVYGEGWALYSEKLGHDMNMYRNDLDRMGALSFEAWRSSRLVVDTGIHALGWSREKATTYLLEHTAMSPQNVNYEVDRYITTPGQALAYKVGQLEILALREKAKQELGDKYKLADFHDAVLGSGAVTIPVLRKLVDEYIAAKK